MPATGIVFVETRTEDKRNVLCKWVEHFYEGGRKVQLSVESTSAAQHLDELLWTFAQGSFIPHRIASSAALQPILEPVVIVLGQARMKDFDVLIADTAIQLEAMEKFDLAVHFILMDDPEKRQESRLLWQAAKDKGFQLRHVPYSSNLQFE